MEEFILAYVDEDMSYNDALEMASDKDREAALNFLMSLEIGTAIQARLER